MNADGVDEVKMIVAHKESAGVYRCITAMLTKLMAHGYALNLTTFKVQ